MAFSGCAVALRGPAVHITTTTAELQGEVGSNRPELGEWWFEYGPTPRYFQQAGEVPTFIRRYRRDEVLEILDRLGLEHVAFDAVEHDSSHTRLLVVARKPV